MKRRAIYSLLLLSIIGSTTMNVTIHASEIENKRADSQSSSFNLAKYKTNAQSSTNESSVNSITKSNISNPNKKMSDNNPNLIDPVWNQNYHYNSPEGQSNDIQSILPHYNKHGKVDYYDIYYLWNVEAIVNSNQWYHLRTKDFSHFYPGNDADPISTKNVAIPDKKYGFQADGSNGYGVDGYDKVELQPNNYDNHIPWSYVVTGSVIMNNSRNGKKVWFKKDQWGNHIDSDAKIAFFSTLDDDSGRKAIYAAYSNKDQQYHPLRSDGVVDSSIVDGQLGSDFRDPYITTYDKGKKLVMYVAGGTNKDIKIITSNNGIDWKYNPDLDIKTTMFPTLSNNIAETPYVSVMDGQPIMFFGTQDANAAKKENEHLAYMTGHFNSDGIFQPDSNSKLGLIDDWQDLYGGNFREVDDKHLINLNWFGNWNYKWSNHLGEISLPRILTYDKKHNSMLSLPIDPGAIQDKKISRLENNKSKVYEPNRKVIFNFDKPNANFNITLMRNNNNNNNVNLEFNNGNLTISRHNSDNGATDLTTAVKLNKSELSSAQFYLDNNSIDLYLPDVQKTYSILSYDNTRNTPFILTSNVAGQIISYKFSKTKSPVLNDINKLNKEYLKQKEKANNIKTNKFNSSDVKALKKKLIDIKKTLSDAKKNINSVKEYNGDVRSHVFISLANNDMDVVNSLIYQLNREYIQINNSFKSTHKK